MGTTAAWLLVTLGVIAVAGLLGYLVYRTHRLKQQRDLVDRQLQQVAAELEQARADLQEFAHAVSHDLQEPLRAMGGFVGLLQSRYEGQLDAKADEYIQHAVDGAARMQQMLDDLLIHSRINSQGRPFELVDFNLVGDEAIAQLQDDIARASAEIIRQDLPTLRADRLQMVQLLRYLIDNALKFRGSEAPRVVLSAEPREGQWVFSVRDNGIGIDPKYAEQVFTMFHRLHLREEYPGTGAGLALSKRIVQRHGGRIWIEAAPGEGTTVFFTLERAHEGI